MMNRLAKVGGVALMAAAGLVGCRGQQQGGQVQAPPPPEPQPMSSMQPAPFEPVQIQSGGPQPMPMDPYAGGGMGAAPSGAEGGNYVVQKGDTLWSIAQRHYGNGQRWVDIVNANPGLDPKKLPVGRPIVLP